MLTKTNCIEWVALMHVMSHARGLWITVNMDTEDLHQGPGCTQGHHHRGGASRDDGHHHELGDEEDCLGHDQDYVRSQGESERSRSVFAFTLRTNAHVYIVLIASRTIFTLA
jgi:hypothetical protein